MLREHHHIYTTLRTRIPAPGTRYHGPGVCVFYIKPLFLRRHPEHPVSVLILPSIQRDTSSVVTKLPQRYYSQYIVMQRLGVAIQS